MEWQSVSLAYVFGQMSLDVMQEVEEKLCASLSIHCRHVGILRYLAQSVTGIWVRFQESGAADVPSQQSGLLHLLTEQFWGMAQTGNGRLQIQASEWVAYLQGIGFVEQTGEDAYTHERCYRINGKGRAALARAMELMEESERRIFSQLPREFHARFLVRPGDSGFRPS